MCVARPNLCGWWDTGSVRARGGFTIIEVMLTIGILVLIAGLIVPTFTSWRREAAFDAGKTSLADSISRCANLSQRDGIARVLVAETTTLGTTRLIVQQLKGPEGQGTGGIGAGGNGNGGNGNGPVGYGAGGNGGGGNSGGNGGGNGGGGNGDENVPKGTILVELGVGIAVVAGEAGDTKGKSDTGDGPVQIALCVAMPDGMIRRSESTIRLTQADGAATATATLSAAPGGMPTVTQGTTGLLRSSVMLIDEFTGRVGWRDEEINQADGTPASKAQGGKGERGGAA